MVTVEQHTCQHCGKAWTRPPTKGQRPKWCPDCRTNSNGGRVKMPSCTNCGAECKDRHSTQCWTCYNAARKPGPKQLTLTLPRDLRSPLRRAIEANNHAGVIAAIRERCTIAPDGCWLWTGALCKSGYPLLKIRGRNYPIHRIALQAKHGRPLGAGMSAHHTCAVRRCASPDHLQPVTRAENNAEMLARRAYVDRIAELESALSDLDPAHPLLRTIPTELGTRAGYPLGPHQPHPMA